MGFAAYFADLVIFLLIQNRSERDKYYARYLFTFTFTQLIDIL